MGRPKQNLTEKKLIKEWGGTAWDKLGPAFREALIYREALIRVLSLVGGGEEQDAIQGFIRDIIKRDDDE